VNEFSFNKKIFIGGIFQKAAAGTTELCFPGVSEANSWLLENPVFGMTILVKGSRKMQLETLANLL
jgi:UDP-N-acetylmuramyl pentapeptide synthase